MLNDNQATAMAEIMRYRFATLETALYLDTHPNDADVLARHNYFARELHERCMDYQQTYNEPLTLFAPAENEWTYINNWCFGNQRSKY